MHLSHILILLFYSSILQIKAEFQIGRLREGQYEYPKLNRWMTPSRAKKRCDKDEKCGGFTYKGFITNDQNQKFNIFFFHLILNFEDSVEVWNWVTYKSEKEYIKFENKTDPEAQYYGSSQLLNVAKAQVNKN